MKRWAWLQKIHHKCEQVASIFDTSNQWDLLADASLQQLPDQKPHRQGESAAQCPAMLAVTWLPRSRALAQGDHQTVKRLFQLQVGMSTCERLLPRRQVQYTDLGGVTEECSHPVCSLLETPLSTASSTYILPPLSLPALGETSSTC